MEKPDLNIEAELQRLKNEMGLINVNIQPSSSPPVQRVKSTAIPKQPKKQPHWWRKFKFNCFLGGTLIGGLAFVNLPVPVIREFVEDKAPILLLPSFISWDYNYRQALPKIEQAEQLILNPTTPEDLTQAEKVLSQAEQHVAMLPSMVELDDDFREWYWKLFSYNEFRDLRKSIGHMKAKLFQEKQSQSVLSQTETELAQAKTLFNQARTFGEQYVALDRWALALNKFEQISADTLAGDTARIRLKLYHEEYDRAKALIGR